MARRKSYQRGSVVERKCKDGIAYILRYRIRRPEGGWLEKSETLRHSPNKKCSLKELNKRLQVINATNGGKAESRSGRFCDILTSAWPNYLENAGVKPSTRYSYESILERWITPFFGNRLLEEISPQQIGDFMSHLSSKGLSPQSRKNIYSLLKLLFDVGVENELLAGNPIRPKIHRPKVARDEKHVFSISQVQRLLSAIEPRWLMPIVTLAMTGIRTGELLGLQWKNLSFLERRITITHSLWRGNLVRPKTKASAHTIAMPEPLYQILLEHRKQAVFTAADDFVFCRTDGRPLRSDSLRRSGIYPAMERAGIPFVKRASGCHAFRHLVGSIVNNETGNLKLAQRQLGHATITTTADIYTHVQDEGLDEAASALGRTLGESVVKLWYKSSLGNEKVQ